MPVSRDYANPTSDPFLAQMQRVVQSAKPGAFPDAYTDWANECAAQIGDAEWMNDAVLERAVEISRQHMTKVPTVKEFVGICKLAESELRQEAERATRRALPPPAPMAGTQSERLTRPDRAFWERNVAIGKARGRRKQAAADAYRKSHRLKASDPVPVDVIRAAGEPSGAEVASVLAAMGRPQSDEVAAVPGDEAPFDPDAFLESISLQSSPRPPATPEWPGLPST
jgi:hypothetical protein